MKHENRIFRAKTCKKERQTVQKLTLGSLFDGIGGFPLAAALSGITPVWAAEIDPACVAVTRRHFPDMLHFGDVSEIDGAKIPPVDIITFGSPCQDLSIAGKRAGLDGARSGLFLEAIRIIYEMREATHGVYPTFLVWENVPGAFSSGNGRNFQTVLKEITKTDIPMPASGRWANAGVVRSGGVCVAWRVLDAQYWGVPQRRKRIYLIGSFGDRSAEQILFKPDRVRRYLAPREVAGKGTAADPAGSAAVSHTVFDARGNGDGWTAPTVTGDHNGRVSDYTAVCVFDKAQITSPQTRTLDLNGGDPRCNQGGTLVCEKQTRWIVRRLTPLECERLQGYPDGWTVLPKIKTMSEAEYELFLRAYLTDKRIKGQVVKKTPTREQMVRWYKKLDSDSTRYRQLGNSLAIPCALRVIGGIAEHIRQARHERKGEGST